MYADIMVCVCQT